MKVILTQDVPHVGVAGEIKEVSDGYARNFLIPRQMAQVATGATVAALEADRSGAVGRHKKELHEARRLAASLQRISLVIQVKSGEGGKLYGSVTKAMIAAALAARSFEIKKEQVLLEHSIREVGEHRVTIGLPHGLEVEVLIEVRSMNAEV